MRLRMRPGATCIPALLATAAPAVLVLLLMGGPMRLASGTHNSVVTSVGLDADTTGNTATSLGTIQRCNTVAPGGALNVDFWIKDVLSPGIEAFQGTIRYDKSRLKVTGNNVSLLLAANAGSNVQDFTNPEVDSLPDSDGVFTPTVFDFGVLPGHSETGSGVLARVTFQAYSAASGVSQLTLTTVKLVDPSNNAIGDINGDNVFDGDNNADPALGGQVQIAIGQPCPTPTPTPSPTSTPTPTVTPTLTPNPCGFISPWLVPPGDSDCDGWTDAEEALIGTSPSNRCGTDWPANLNNTGSSMNKADIFDVNALAPPVFFSMAPGPPYTARKDIARAGTSNGRIDIFDVNRLAPPVFFATCTP